MERQAFWELFDEWCGQAGSPANAPQTVLANLRHLPDRDIVAFDRHLKARLASSYNWRLWGAAHLLTGGNCPTNTFRAFRLWLMTYGRAVYEGIVAEPERLADLDPRYGQLEPLFFIPTRAYEHANGGLIPFTPVPDSNLDKAWSFDDDAAMKARYPRLWDLTQ
ncbi:MAG: DUF4240 domain-containing protein [Actinomycetia bacterium]|nr:DUF4240 domain-containing protein [Actinomycetes bacterium]